MRTTLVIDDDVLEDARQIAAADGRTIGAVISELARRSLVPIGIDESAEFPTFAVPPGSPTITEEHVATALDHQ